MNILIVEYMAVQWNYRVLSSREILWVHVELDQVQLEKYAFLYNRSRKFISIFFSVLHFMVEKIMTHSIFIKLMKFGQGTPSNYD